MKKTLGVWFSLRLILAIAASAAAYTTTSGVTFENGCLSGYWYFHLECDDGTKTCELSQYETTSPTVEDYQCWYDGTGDDLISALNADKTNYTLSVTSSIDLGGYDASKNLCVMDFSPITANYFSVDGNRNIIDGFCYVTTGDVGFFRNRSNEAKNIKFKNAYVKGTGKVGVFANYIGRATLTNITIDGATVVGGNAGGVAGDASYFNWTNSLINNVNVSGDIVGGAFGTVNFSSGSDGWNAQYDTLSGNSVIKGSTIAGGFIGSATISAGRLNFELGNSTIDADVSVENADASYNGNLVAGGLIGNLKTTSNYYNYVNLRNNILKGSVKVLANDVTGNVYVGALVGNAENSGRDSPYLSSRELTNNMNVEANLGSIEGNVAVGGAVGNALNFSTYYGLIMELNKYFQEGSVKLETENVKGNVAIGGVFGNFEREAEFEDSKFEGPVSYTTKQFDSQSFLYMGSIWGNANKASLEVQNSCSFGNISYSGVNADQANIGYLGGYSDESESDRRIRNNYHYGQDDIIVGIGNYNATVWGEGATTEGNCSNCLYIEDNVRNAIDDTKIDREANHRNRIYSEAEMKTDSLAYKLGYDLYEGNMTWSRRDDTLGGLPFFASDGNLPIKRVALDVSSFGQDVINKIKVKGYRFSSTGDSVYIYSNYSGNLNKSDVDFFNGLLDETHYWSGPVAISTSSLFIGDAEYGYRSVGTWYVAYHFCVGKVQNGDAEYDIWPDYSPVSGYEMDFIFTPVTEFKSADYSKMVPPLYVSGAQEIKFLKASLIRVNSRTVGKNPIEWLAAYDSIFAYDQRAYDLVRYLENKALVGANIEDYSDTLHVFYEFGSRVNENTFELVVNSINGVLPSVSVKSFVYDISNGSWGKLTNSNTVSTGAGTIPVATGFTIGIDNVPTGYSKENYSLVFNYSYLYGIPDTIISDDNYLVRPADFMLNDGYKKHVWMKENLTPKDTIRLDSVYRALGRISAGMYEMQMAVVPSPINYNVSFDLGDVEGLYFVFGNNWATKKENVNVLTNRELPRLYLRSQSVGGGANSVNYTIVEWSSIKNATANDPHGRILTTEMLDRAIISESGLSLYPYLPIRSSAATAIRIIAVDGDGNSLTGQSDYYGSIALAQKVSGDEKALSFVQNSSECAVGEHTDGNVSVKEYNHCLYVPNVEDTLIFAVTLKPVEGCSMTITDHSFKWQDPSGGPAEVKPGFGFETAGTDSTLVVQPYYMAPSGANDQMYFKVKYTITGPFYVTYDLNTDDYDAGKLFFPNDAATAGEFKFSETVTSVELWRPFRSDKCFDGWSVVSTASAVGATMEPPKITTLDASYALSALSLDPDAPTTLRANWDDCAALPAAGVTIANSGTNAKVMLKQVFGGKEYEHLLGANSSFALPTNSSGYKFIIDSANSVVDLGYEMTGVSAKYTMNGVDHELPIEGDSIVVGKTNVSEYSVTVNTQVALNGQRFYLAGNADTVFYGSSITKLEVDAQKGDSITTDVYRVGYKLKGWNFVKTIPQNSSETSQQPTQPTVVAYASNPHLVFDAEFETDYVMFAKTFGRLPDTLYAVWEADANAGVKRVVNKSGDVSSFRLMQDFSGQAFDYLVSDSLLLPAEGHFEFIVEMIYDPNKIEVNNRRAIVVLNEDGELDEILENNTPYIIGKSIGLKANVLKDKRVQFVLNENSEDKVYFGSDWIDTVATENPDSSLALPTIAYNSAKCLAGWTLDSTSDSLLKVLDKDLLNDLRAKGNAQGRSISELLYAKWTTNPDSCIGDFVQLAVEQDNGTIWFAEGDKKGTERRFTEEGTMFVPSELDGSQFKVRALAADTSVYVLDSLVVLRKNKVVKVLKEGDSMPANLKGVTLKAYFGWKNKTEVAFKRMPRLDVNGVRFRLGFKASDFEARRKVSARVEVIDQAGLRVKLDTLLGDSIEMGYEKKDFMFPMKKPGNYTMVLTLKDKSNFVVTDSIDFSVSSEIPAIAADSWQMLSLSSVDMSALKNDGDQIFFWWDEQGTGEFWQYKRLDVKAPVNPTLGVWYKSFEGRALPLVMDEDDESEDEDFTWEMENVNTGWNIVANPYNWSLDLYAKNPNAKKDFDEESEISFWRYDAELAEPVPVDTIGPYEAVWAHVPKNAKWKMSADPYFPPDTVPLEKRALAKASTKDRWTLQVKLTDMNGKQDSWNILGAGLNPLVADEPPAGMGDHVNLAIVEGKRALAKSIKPSGDEMEWNLALSASNDRVGYLSLAGIDGVKAFGYRVFVTVDGNTTEMREGEPLKVYLKSSAKMATVRVAPAARSVAKNMLKGLRTARLGNRLQVTFDAMGLAGTNARVDILDMKGHVKSTVTAKTLEGTNALVLDAPQSGLYMLRVRAGSQQQVAKIVVR